MVYKEIADKIGSKSKIQDFDFLDIGGVLSTFMKEKKLDGTTLARLSGVSKSEVYNILSNRRGHSGLETLRKLANPLGKTLADIFNKLAQGQKNNAIKYDKDPFSVTEFRKQGFTIFSDTAPNGDFLIGRISFLAGGKGIVSQGLKDNCSFFLRVAKGSLEVKYGEDIHLLSIYQKIVFNGRYSHSIKNKSSTETAETLIITTPSMWSLSAA